MRFWKYRLVHRSSNAINVKSLMRLLKQIWSYFHRYMDLLHPNKLNSLRYKEDKNGLAVNSASDSFRYHKELQYLNAEFVRELIIKRSTKHSFVVLVIKKLNLLLVNQISLFASAEKSTSFLTLESIKTWMITWRSENSSKRKNQRLRNSLNQFSQSRLNQALINQNKFKVNMTIQRRNYRTNRLTKERFIKSKIRVSNNLFISHKWFNQFILNSSSYSQCTQEINNFNRCTQHNLKFPLNNTNLNYQW